jgi:cyanophycin synthetase
MSQEFQPDPLPPRWWICENPTAVPGYTHGLRHPALVVRVRRGHTGWPAALDARLQAAFPGTPLPGTVSPGDDAAPVRILQWNRIIQRAAGLPVYEDGLILHRREEPRTAILLVPSYDSQLTQRVVSWLEHWSNRLIAPGAGDMSVETVGVDAGRLLEELKRHFPQNANSLRFVDAAYGLGIPWEHLGGGVLQFGQGRRARRMHSSFTDATSIIAGRIARQKELTGNLLRRGGLPGTFPQAVISAEMAVNTAERIGYPVVIKPADKDGGVGVAAGLNSADEVRHAYEAARKHSRHILLEKHFHGRDYRLSVLHGRLLWAIERVPGGVLGDGIRTIRELIAETNRDPQRGPTSSTPLYPLELDAEAESLLAAAGLGPDSIPAEGRRIRLRRSANVSRGGYPVAVNEQVHPDNKALAERAALLVGLDLAGIDLLIPDIATSWRESGALICEVNAQPQFGMLTAAHVYGEILQQLLQGDGRIPSVAVLGQASALRCVDDVVLGLAKAGLQVGSTDGQAANIGINALACQPGLQVHGNALLLQHDLDALIMLISDAAALDQGLPCDRVDWVLIADDADGSLLGPALPRLLPACRGGFITVSSHPAVPQLQSACARRGLRLEIEATMQDLAVHAIRTLLV